MKKITFLLSMLLVATISFAQTTIFSENFDGTTLPTNWSNLSVGTGSHYWTFGSGVVPGAVADFTTNAAVFDDDAAGDTGNHDAVWLWHGANSSGSVGDDVSMYGQVTLHYDYALNEGGNGETLTIGIWNGTIFIPVKVYTVDTPPTSDSIDVTTFIHAYPSINPSSLFIGFKYDDNTSWGWGAGIDNVELTGSAQPDNDFIFRHKATAANTSSYITTIDNLALNNNPDAKIVVSHNWNGSGSGGVYNDNVTGVYYAGGHWRIYNEDHTTPMPLNATYNVYVRGKDSNVITHISTPENQGVISGHTVIDNPLTNGHANANLVVTTNWNPNNMYNNLKYGVFYNGTNWNIFCENATAIPTNAAFNVIVAPSGVNVQTFRHQNTPANTNSNVTVIDNPLLNGKPNSVFVFTHNYGTSGDASNVNINKNLGAYYQFGAGKWAIYTEDQSAMPNNAIFNIVVQNAEVANLGSSELTQLTLYPNPVDNIMTINSKDTITKILVFNMLGQEVKALNPASNTINLDVSDLDAGIYAIKIVSNKKQSNKKFIKK